MSAAQTFLCYIFAGENIERHILIRDIVQPEIQQSYNIGVRCKIDAGASALTHQLQFITLILTDDLIQITRPDNWKILG